MKAKEFIIEYKKDRRAPKYSLKPRSPVAHAAQSVISGSGAHKDKKRAEKQGDVKHKNRQIDMAEGVRDLEYDAQSLIMKLRRDVEEKRLQPTRQAVLMAARELAGDMDFAPELLVKQVLGQRTAEEGIGSKLAGLGLAGAMAFGAGGANARVTPDGQGGVTGGIKPAATMSAPTDQKPAVQAPAGFSKEYLQKAADPNRTGRYMISVEKAQELLKQMDTKVGEGTKIPFAGAKVGHKEGPEGQWRNDGPKKNKPAKPGDLVGSGM